MKNTHSIVVPGLLALLVLSFAGCATSQKRVEPAPSSAASQPASQPARAATPAPGPTAPSAGVAPKPAAQPAVQPSAPAAPSSAGNAMAPGAPAPDPLSSICKLPLPTSQPAVAPNPVVDPAGYMRFVRDRAQTLTAYTARLIRTERRGLLFKLEHGPENISAWFRQEPFSVRFDWIDKDSKNGEAAYIAGKHDNKVRFVPRVWVPPLLPGINAVEVGTPVALGEALNPISDFGLRRMMERAVANIDRAGDAAAIRYVERKLLPEVGVEVHHIHVDFPADQNVAPRQDMFIDCKSNLPVGAILRKTDGTLHGAYYYADLNTDVSLTDDDFLMNIERKRAEKAK